MTPSKWTRARAQSGGRARAHKVVDARARAQKKSVRKQPLPPKIPKWKISHTITQDPIWRGA